MWCKTHWNVSLVSRWSYEISFIISKFSLPVTAAPPTPHSCYIRAGVGTTAIVNVVGKIRSLSDTSWHKIFICWSVSKRNQLNFTCPLLGVVWVSLTEGSLPLLGWLRGIGLTRTSGQVTGLCQQKAPCHCCSTWNHQNIQNRKYILQSTSHLFPCSDDRVQYGIMTYLIHNFHL